MKLTKNQLKTWNSQQSDIDLFSKLENSFLQKFFRLNLVDYFDDMIMSVPEIHTVKKFNNKTAKSLLTSMFRVERDFIINEFEQKMHTFYKKNAKSFETGELQHAFKTRYCNWNPVPNLFKRGEIIQLQVKIKAEIQKLQQIPKKLYDSVEYHTRGQRANEDYQIMKKTFQNYKLEYFNFFIVYFGDINFHLVRKEHYQVREIKVFGRKLKLRMFTFFVSKQALLEKFRSMNKITNLDHINDLVIQFYEIKREKRRQKIKKERETISLINKSKIQTCKDVFSEYSSFFKYFVAGGVGLTALIFVGTKLTSVTN